MFFTKKSQALRVATGLIAVGLLAAACGGEKKKDERPQSVHVKVEGPVMIPAPAVTATPQVPTPEVTPTVTPTPVVTPTPAVIPTPEVTPTPAVTPAPSPEKPSLPAARALTDDETLQYLTNTDTFIQTEESFPRTRGTGYDTKKNSFRAICMEHDPNLLLLTQDARPTEEYSILPLTSARQVKEALGYQDASLYMSGRIDTSNPKRLGVIAIAKKIRKVVHENSMMLRGSVADVDDTIFTNHCGQLYKKGDVHGYVNYSVIWIELDAENTREAVLSRLIDSKTLGTYKDLTAFSGKLQALTQQIANTDAITLGALEAGYNFSEGMSPTFSFDFSPMLKAWSDAVDQVELAKVPEIGSIFGSYPDRSTPAKLTGETSQ